MDIVEPLLIYSTGPPTPEGIVVGTPKPEVQGAGLSVLQPGWLPNPLESCTL